MGRNEDGRRQDGKQSQVKETKSGVGKPPTGRVGKGVNDGEDVGKQGLRYVGRAPEAPTAQGDVSGFGLLERGNIRAPRPPRESD